MHERSLVRALLRQVEDLAAKHPGSHVVKVQVRVGEFSGVEPDLLASAYHELAADTTLQTAVLDLERVPLEGFCDRCNHRFRVERFKFECDRCGSPRISLRGGEEMMLESVTMEEAEL